MGKLHFATALVPGGWRDDVRVTVANGVIAAVETGVEAGDATRFSGAAVPGLPNLHSHAFQRGMAGLAERRGPSADSFWTWREVMYRFLDRLTPDDVEAIAAFAYRRDAGGRLHRGRRVPLPAPRAATGALTATSPRWPSASRRRPHATGIGLTLLPVFYAQGNFGGAPPVQGQRRFLSDRDGFARLVEASAQAIAGLAGCEARHRAAFAARRHPRRPGAGSRSAGRTGRSTSMSPSR